MMTQERTQDGESEPLDGVEAVFPVGGASGSLTLNAEEAAGLKQRAAEIVYDLEEASGSKELELADGITAVGIQAQRRAGEDLDFLRARVGELLSDKGASGQVTKDLVELRLTLERIAPMMNGRARGLLRALPFSAGMVKQLERIAVRYETISRQVVQIERRLAEGRALLRRDNVELRKLYEDVETQQTPIERNIYLGEALMNELQELLSRTTDPMKRDRFQTVLFDVSMRVQDLRTMQEVHTQFFVSIEMTRVNNSRLGQAVERTLSLTTSTLMVGLAIQAALSRQKQVLAATQRTRQFLGDLVATNAAVIKQQVNEIGDVYRNPVVAIEKLTQAHNDLIEALNTAGRLEAEGIEMAKANVDKLRQLTQDLAQRTTAIAPPLESTSVEA
jgi:uncharacterized protein YaaN involved in tellurite resistance